jgi:hypothetical protein
MPQLYSKEIVMADRDGIILFWGVEFLFLACEKYIPQGGGQERDHA